MKRPNSMLPAIAAFLLLGFLGVQAQQPGPGGLPGGGRGGPGGLRLPAEQQTEVDRIMAALEPETKAVWLANSNLVAATVRTATDQEAIAKANAELAKTRADWAAKASRLVAENQGSEKKLSQDALARLIQRSSGGREGQGLVPGGPRRPPGPRE